MKILTESKEESNVFGLKIARANNIQSFNYKEIADDVHSSQLDLFRVKISMTDPTVFDNIDGPVRVVLAVSVTGIVGLSGVSDDRRRPDVSEPVAREGCRWQHLSVRCWTS